MKNWLDGFVAFVLDIFFPKRCVNCAIHGEFVCEECLALIEKIKTDTCFFCGKISRGCQICEKCRSKYKTRLKALFAAVHYDSPMKEIIYDFKYSRNKGWAALLAEFIDEKMIKVADSSKNVVIQAVPLHAKRQRVRGFNQAEEIAAILAAEAEIPQSFALKRVKETKAQFGLKKGERFANIAGAFACTKPAQIEGKNVFLIDDIATTGSTIIEAANVLRAGGAKSVTAFVVARHI